MAKTRRRLLSEWTNVPKSKTMPPRAVEAIARRRRQMLIHNCIYYRLDDSTIDDFTWMKWAQQLAKLQEKYGWKIGFYDLMFQGWCGSSGFDMQADENVMRVALRTLAYSKDVRDLLS